MDATLAINNLFNSSLRLSEEFGTLLTGEKKGEKARSKYRSLLIELRTTLDLIENEEWDAFDGLVGENLCHVRALMISLLAPTMRSHMANIRIPLERIILQLEEESQNKQECFAIENFELTIPRTLYFFFLNHLLTIGKDFQPTQSITVITPSERTNLRRLKDRFFDVSMRYVERLVHHSKKALASMTRDFLNFHSLKTRIRHPFFETLQIVLDQVKNLEIPFSVRIHVLNSETYDLQYTHTLQNQQRSIGRPVLVFEGMMQRPFNELPTVDEVERELIAHGLYDLFLMCAADHKQYVEPNGRLREQYLNYKTLAQRVGCSSQNPHLFFLYHVFCADIRFEQEAISDVSKKILSMGSQAQDQCYKPPQEEKVDLIQSR